MGYFSQKKKRQRENMFLVCSLVFLSLMTLISSFDGNGTLCFFIKNYFFQLYLFNIFIFLFVLLRQKVWYVVWALVLLLFGYAHISSAANIFINTKVEHADKTFSLQYSPLQDKNKILAQISGMTVKHYGKIRLSPRHSAQFTTYQEGNNRLTLVRVNFAGIKYSEQKILFDNLAEFVAQRDEPLVIYGNFGTPGWSSYFKNFLHKASLEIKNRIILTDLNSFFSLFNVPVINLVAYNNIGIAAIDEVVAADGKSDNLLFQIQYLSTPPKR